MAGILADNDVEGHVERLLDILQSEPWGEFWAEMQFTLETFETLGVPRDATDAVIWKACQARQTS